MESYRVFANIDDSGVILDINSSEFLSDITGWVQIDEGTGDRSPDEVAQAWEAVTIE